MTLYKELIAIYWEWHIDKVGFKPLIDKSDGEGLKKMIKYLASLSDDESSVIDMFKYILLNWDSLDEFYKKNTRLRQINGNIHNIIHSFKSGKHSKNRSGVSQSYLEKVVSEMRDANGCS